MLCFSTNALFCTMIDPIEHSHIFSCHYEVVKLGIIGHFLIGSINSSCEVGLYFAIRNEYPHILETSHRASNALKISAISHFDFCIVSFCRYDCVQISKKKPVVQYNFWRKLKKAKAQCIQFYMPLAKKKGNQENAQN